MSSELTHTSARATPSLVGRKEILKQIEQFIRDLEQTYLVYITGSGGIGKTRLVMHILEKFAPQLQGVSLRVAKHPVDLYHTFTHSREGFINALYKELKGTEQEFENYHRERQELEKISDLGAQDTQRNKMVKAFLDDLNALATKQRVVLALDTTERLFFESDPVQKRLGLEEEKIAILNWFFDFLSQVEHAVILLSGRTERGSLGDGLQEIPGKNFKPIHLQGLTEEETIEYFDEVIKACEAPGELQDIPAADKIRQINPDLRRRIFYSLCDWDEEKDTLTIRPIWLALAIDYWVIVAPKLLPEWEASVADIQSKAKQNHADTRDQLARELLESLRQGERAPADDVILALGMATKGADADLLFHILEGDRAQIETALNKIRDLSFVKIRRPDDRFFSYKERMRSSDNRFFLHDEMYAILQRHVLDLPKYEPMATKVLKRIVAWYNARIDNHRKTITRLYEQHEKEFYGSDEVSIERVALHDALVEDLHYQLCLNPTVGFETYFRYSDDAIATGNESLDAQLRSELLTFWSACDPENAKQEIRDLRRVDVEADMAIRWVKRLVELGDKQKARQLIAQLRGESSKLIQASGKLAEIELGIWEARADAYGAKLDEAEDELKQRITELKEMPQSLHRNAILALAYNHLGYVYRSTGRYFGAIEYYARARSIWRIVKIAGEQANTLTNLSFALAMIGEFGDAWRQGLDARDLRLISGTPASVGLSLTALARLAIEEDTLDDSLRFLNRAITLFNPVSDQRGKGLALTARAETTRRMSWWMDPYPDQTANLLEQAANDALEAIGIFDGGLEPARQVEALIEKGCAYRDWVKFYRDNPDALKEEESKGTGTRSLKDLAQKSQQAFEQAQQIAEQHNLRYLCVDALVNLAWLHHYRNAGDQAIQLLDKRVEQIIPQEYRIKPYEQGPSGLRRLEPREVIVPFLTQLGKMELLRGRIAFGCFAQNRDENVLRDAITHYALSLAYDAQYRTQEFRDLRRAKDRIYERLKTLNADEMLIVYETAANVERKYRPGASSMRKFLESNFGPRDDFLGDKL